MTTETQKAPSAYARAEASSRKAVLHVGLGVVAFILGSIFSVGASARIGERLGPIDSEWGSLVFRWVFERLWLLAVLPMFGYAMGRFTEVKPSRFALTAAISGELFSVLLVTAINGFEYLLEDTGALLTRGVTLFVGMFITVRVVMLGRADAEAAQVEANVVAEKRKAEYAEFLAAAEGKGTAAPGPELAASSSPPAETVSPLPDPLPRGGEGDKAPGPELVASSSPPAETVSPLPDPLPQGGEGEKAAPAPVPDSEPKR